MRTAEPSSLSHVAPRLVRRRKATPDEIEQLQSHLESSSLREITALVARLSAVRGAKILRMLPPERSRIVFDQLKPRHQADVIVALGDDDVVGYFGALGAEDRVALLDNLPAEIAARLLKELDEDDQHATNIVLGYRKGTVGRTMSPKVPEVTAEMTVREVVDQLRRDVDKLETIYAIPVIDGQRSVVGVTDLRRLFRCEGGERIEDVMGHPVYVRSSDSAEDASRWLMSTPLLGVPVVDDDDRLVGILTHDEAQDVVEHANTEDSARTGASEPLGKPYLSTSVLQIVRSRIVWLLVLAISAVLTVKVLDVFQATLEKAVVLSLFIPLLTGTGGNTGNQAATTVTRALALNDVHRRDFFKVMFRELRVGMTMGATLGTLGFIVASIVFDPRIGLVIGATLFLVCSLSATVGGAMPIVAKTIGADPAVFSNPFISTFCDASGLIIYFLIAKAVLGL
ncbi:Magnesium transporter MgtE [Corynebacterium capitovis DSM 44611]|uniref:magnesium transporter n=1 Tax=Corynebacterium capitovis TaxID=131081 RepID=UPI000376F93B|nr:magnesium transporter [Corynebacterium capitovis]WKD56667.1 Magnesium transporter MgtE [Corynebacterium capitovis DSM 44611]